VGWPARLLCSRNARPEKGARWTRAVGEQTGHSLGMMKFQVVGPQVDAACRRKTTILSCELILLMRIDRTYPERS
jgi:hypothetical protein